MANLLTPGIEFVEQIERTVLHLFFIRVLVFNTYAETILGKIYIVSSNTNIVSQSLRLVIYMAVAEVVIVCLHVFQVIVVVEALDFVIEVCFSFQRKTKSVVVSGYQVNGVA